MHFNIILALSLLMGLVSCTQKPVPSTATLPTPTTRVLEQPTNSVPEFIPTGTQLAPERLLTICLGHEPDSLFYYDATSTAAQDVLAAIYDGPTDIRNYAEYPVILKDIPSLSNGMSRLEPVQVAFGDLMVDRSGNLVNLDAGVEYRPSGCDDFTCTQSYSGDQPVTMDQWILDFKLLPDLQWSDGTPLTAADSVYSYEIAQALYPAAQPELVLRTQSYQALDQTTVEWKGIPGYQDGIYRIKFFIPLPQHAWNSYSAAELRNAEVASRRPIGWGPYIIDQWIAGDHISLRKNPLYFRSNENIPRFDNLVFRFVNSTDEAMDALQVGECDLVDQTAMFDAESSRLAELLQNNQVQVFDLIDAGWEQITFGINPLDSKRVRYFDQSQVRQAVAMCIDREALIDAQVLSTQQIANSYIPASHPLYNPDIQTYDFDLQQAATLLESAGWLDADNDPQTPRVALGVEGVPDGTTFEVEYLVSSDVIPQEDAQAIQAMLGNCGIKATIAATSPQEFLTPGPDGPVFGRAFDVAQFAWAGSYTPPCNLYLSGEIPGPYPDFPKGWGGVNASGYSNPIYDQACEIGLFSLADAPQHKPANYQAQQIFSTDLPALPLYFHYNVSVGRQDLCKFTSVSAVDSPLWFIEQLDYGSGCSE
jgi:peptide/nickel transport system substrate-binding protein